MFTRLLVQLMLLTDGYKLDHRRQYPKRTQFVYSNFTPRSSRIPGVNKVVLFGLQYFLQHYMMEYAKATFFDRPKDEVLNEYSEFLFEYLGPNDIGVGHISRLYDLGYIPLEFKAVPEGTHVPLRMPMFTMENTIPEFFWVTNYFETLISNVLWMPCTSATTAATFKKLLVESNKVTNPENAEFVNWQGHDFSFRGMSSVEAASLSGAAHLLSFTGTDTIPAIKLLEQYYDGEGLIGGSVAATEHSVMCAGGKESELETFMRLLDLYQHGIISIVSDTWDFWKVVREILPSLKDRIMARDGKVVIRPDSGDPVFILCGDVSSDDPFIKKGLIECLWDIFGGTISSTGYKVLDPHIGAIYGDSITLDRADQIISILTAKGFDPAPVLGIGSFTYQYVTRDTFGFAIKATHAVIDGEEHMLYKDPATDNGTKKSAKGKIALVWDDEVNDLIMYDGLDNEQLAAFERSGFSVMRTVWKNGDFVGPKQTLTDIRKQIAYV